MQDKARECMKAQIDQAYLSLSVAEEAAQTLRMSGPFWGTASPAPTTLGILHQTIFLALRDVYKTLEDIQLTLEEPAEELSQKSGAGDSPNDAKQIDRQPSQLESVTS
jgi:hypothetical protein